MRITDKFINQHQFQETLQSFNQQILEQEADLRITDDFQFYFMCRIMGDLSLEVMILNPQVYCTLTRDFSKRLDATIGGFTTDTNNSIQFVIPRVFFHRLPFAGIRNVRVYKPK